MEKNAFVKLLAVQFAFVETIGVDYYQSDE